MLACSSATALVVQFYGGYLQAVKGSAVDQTPEGPIKLLRLVGYWNTPKANTRLEIGTPGKTKTWLEIGTPQFTILFANLTSAHFFCFLFYSKSAKLTRSRN